MAEITLHPDIENLETNDPSRFNVFQILLQGMKEANNVDMPDYSLPPYAINTGKMWVDADGNEIALYEPNQAAIEAKMAEIADIQMQNAAYMLARVIDTASSSSSTGIDISKLVQKNGDLMLGSLGALRGFEAGYDDNKIFDVILSPDNSKVAHVYGRLIVDDDLDVLGNLNLSDSGIFFSKHQTIYLSDGALNINYQDIIFSGDVEFDGTIKVGNITLNNDGIYWNNKEFYHSDNCNNQDTDWSMKDGHVYGDLIIDGTTNLSGRLVALKGFDLGNGGRKLLYSSSDPQLQDLFFATDITMLQGYGVKFGEDYILYLKGESNDIVSLSAPGRVLNLGDAGKDSKMTEFISLQSDIKNDRNTYVMISSNGDGCFRNSFKAGTSNAGPIVIQTYALGDNNQGVLFPHYIALGEDAGPYIYSNAASETLSIEIPYTITSGEHLQEVQRNRIDFAFSTSNYPWRNLSLAHDTSLRITSEGEYIVFENPLLCRSFSIFSQQYQTRLQENALFLDTDLFIEGVVDGMAFTGNGYFNNNICSPRFASGFAGYGWGIMKNESTGNIAATFDELTVRKRMRIYELEVQKHGITNGAIWITDSCSGDNVEEL